MLSIHALLGSSMLIGSFVCFATVATHQLFFGGDMTRENKVICNRCGREVQPPHNRGWGAFLSVGLDGVAFEDLLADICHDCRVDVMRFINTPPSRLVS